MSRKVPNPPPPVRKPSPPAGPPKAAGTDDLLARITELEAQVERLREAIDAAYAEVSERKVALKAHADTLEDEKSYSGKAIFRERAHGLMEGAGVFKMKLSKALADTRETKRKGPVAALETPPFPYQEETGSDGLHRSLLEKIEKAQRGQAGALSKIRHKLVGTQEPDDE